MSLPQQGERYDAYCGVIFPIPNTKWRVAVCKDGYQYLLQHRKGQDQWKNRKHFATKARLVAVIRKLLGNDAYLSVKAKLDNMLI